MNDLEDLIEKEIEKTDKDKEVKKETAKELNMSLESIRDKIVFCKELLSISETVNKNNTVNRLCASDLLSLDNNFFNSQVSIEEFTVVDSRTNLDVVKSSIEKRLYKEYHIVKDYYGVILDNLKVISINLETMLHTFSKMNTTKNRYRETLKSITEINPLVYTGGCNDETVNFLNLGLAGYMTGDSPGIKELNNSFSDFFNILTESPVLSSFIYASTSDNEYTSRELMDILSNDDSFHIYTKVKIRDLLSFYGKPQVSKRILRLNKFASLMCAESIKETEDNIEYSSHYYKNMEVNVNQDLQDKLNMLVNINELSLSLGKINDITERFFDAIGLLLGNFE